MNGSSRTVVTRCSLAVRPVDIWTGKPPGGSGLLVRLAESDRKPVRVSDGSYAFLDYPGRECTLLIGSPSYLPFELPLNLNNFESSVPIVTAALRPNRLYPHPAAATGFVFRITDAGGRPKARVSVSAFADDEGAVRGRAADEKTPAGSKRLRVASDTGRILPGDAFVLKSREGADTEWAAVADVSDGDAVLTLETPLSKAWSRGAKLLPAVRTWSDDGGTVVLPLRGHYPPACPVTVRIGEGKQGLETVWTAEPGSVVRMPDIRM